MATRTVELTIPALDPQRIRVSGAILINIPQDIYIRVVAFRYVYGPPMHWTVMIRRGSPNGPLVLQDGPNEVGTFVAKIEREYSFPIRQSTANVVIPDDYYVVISATIGLELRVTVTYDFISLPSTPVPQLSPPSQPSPQPRPSPQLSPQLGPGGGTQQPGPGGGGFVPPPVTSTGQDRTLLIAGGALLVVGLIGLTAAVLARGER